jgi:cephalosporin hydroxylase
VSIDLDERVRTYWLARVRQHRLDMCAGSRISKFPEDLRVYEHLLWACRAEVVIELGAHLGGSALWFRDRLRTMAHYGRIKSGRVIAVDESTEATTEQLTRADPGFEGSITLVEATCWILTCRTASPA